MITSTALLTYGIWTFVISLVCLIANFVRAVRAISDFSTNKSDDSIIVCHVIFGTLTFLSGVVSIAGFIMYLCGK